MVIKTELCQYTEYRIRTQISRVHSPLVRAADCRSAGPWFNSGWRTLFTFVTWYAKLTNHDYLMINITSPITTSIMTITRKSENIFNLFNFGKKKTFKKIRTHRHTIQKKGICMLACVCARGAGLWDCRPVFSKKKLFKVFLERHFFDFF